MNTLIVGGTSGVGLAMAKKLQDRSHTVHITGRHDPTVKGLHYHKLDLSRSAGLMKKIITLVNELPEIDLLVYTPGFYQEGTVTDLSEEQIHEMLNVGVVAAIYLTRQILIRQNELAEFVAITSTSQYTPRLLEPIYTVAKAGLGAYANSLSLDHRVRKTLVAGPAGIKTKFHAGREVDMSTYLTPEWVAEQIIDLLRGNYSYKYARILRDPPHVEIMEER
jgi:short-subunit dehydrogenase